MTSSHDDGWLSSTLDDGTAVHVRIGWRGSDDGTRGHVVITDLMLSADDITTSTLQRIRPSQILAGAFADKADAERAIEAITARAVDGIVTGEVPIESDPFGGSIDLASVRTVGWLTSWIAAHRQPDDAVTLGELRSRTSRPTRRARRKALGRPTGAGDDAFYRRVAEAYRSASRESSRPAVVLSKENNDMPVETVRRWVKEARRRGFLASGRKGRAI